MQNFFRPKPTHAYFPNMQRTSQITNSHCGPATLAMMLSNFGVTVTQDQIVAAAGIGYKIKTHGSTIEELVFAGKRLVPQLSFWSKSDSDAHELLEIVEHHRTPVGVEWQGLFGEYSDGDDGHFGVVTHVDRESGILLLADPYDKFTGQDRLFRVHEFVDRWWDINEVTDPFTRHVKHLADDRSLFIVTRSEENFPEKFGMEKE